jgi:DNA replicative helicase MCM subunit Mcm2 (Cdc46/Mcm family)
MFEGEVNTLGSNWHIGCKPGILVAPQQSVAKEDYKLAFKKCLVDSFKEEVLNLMRVDNFAEKRANRWGDEYSGLSSSTSHTNAASNNNDYDDDELTSSQQEHDRTKEKHYGLEISHRLLCDACPLLAHAVIHALECHSTDTEEKSHGELVWEAFNDAALDAQSYVYQEEIENLKSTYEETELESNEFKLDMSDLLQEMSIKHNVNVRLVDLCGGLRKPNVSSIRSYDVGSFIEIAGTCTRTGKIKMVESERYYKCDSARCGLQFPVRADVDRAYAIDEPKGCPQTACKTKTCSVVPERVICRDW